jgi:hypothetical protein
MYSLTISFGPVGTTWAFLFKDKENAEQCRKNAVDFLVKGRGLEITDDFGQHASITSETIHGISFEDLDLVEAARIYRSLAEERIKIKLQAAAKSDPVIGPLMNSRGPGILTPMGR